MMLDSGDEIAVSPGAGGNVHFDIIGEAIAVMSPAEAQKAACKMLEILDRGGSSLTEDEEVQHVLGINDVNSSVDGYEIRGELVHMRIYAAETSRLLRNIFWAIVVLNFAMVANLFMGIR